MEWIKVLEDDPRLAVKLVKALLVFTVLLLLGAYYVWRRRQESVAISRALQPSVQSSAERLQWFLKGEAAWSFNFAHSTPKKEVAALERLKNIIAQLTAYLSLPEVDCAPLLAAVAELQAFYMDKGNHQWGSMGTALTTKAARGVEPLRDKVNCERIALRLAVRRHFQSVATG